MRRGHKSRSGVDAAEGWTKQELLAAVEVGEGGGPRRGGLSPKTFDMIRKTARVNGPNHGGMTWVFSASNVVAMVRVAEGGRFTERGGPIAAAWRGLLAERGISIENEER